MTFPLAARSRNRRPAGATGGICPREARAVSADGTVVVGESRHKSGYDEAFRFRADTGLIQLGVVPGDSSSVADGVSADGSVIVGSSFGTDTQAFRWTQETGMVGLGTLPGGSRNSSARGVSADGSVIVGQCDGEAGFEAFVWDATHGMRSVRQLLVSQFGLGANLRGWKLRGATAVSADGSVVVGYGMNPRRQPRGLVRPPRRRAPPPRPHGGQTSDRRSRARTNDRLT